MNYLNNFTRNSDDPICFEFPSGPSVTVPDSAINLRQLVDRYTVGRSVPSLEHMAVYDENDDMFVENMDELEKAQLHQDVSLYLSIEKAKRGAPAPSPATPAASAGPGAAPGQAPPVSPPPASAPAPPQA